MATEFNVIVKNLMLNEIKQWEPAGSDIIYIGAFTANADDAIVGNTQAFYGPATNGQLALASSVSVPIPASTIVKHIRIFKTAGTGFNTIYKEDIPDEVFTEAGYLIFEEATIALLDAE